jgi:hypothetical protein
MFNLRYLIIVLLGLTFFTARAQRANPVNMGAAKGIVRDTSRNYVLKSITVSLYKAADSTLLGYQLTNNYGEFTFRNVPTGIPLYLEINHTGYQILRKNFSLTNSNELIDFKTLIVQRQSINLNEVLITLPPVNMNGDTLEFNASAFKLDSNAVVEDLLKALPNVTVWGDGTITVNGSEIKKLKINGKSFFGGEFKVALQNIAKNALQKVQVYKAVEDESNPLDSTLEMNLKLKKGKDFGYFGKIGGGYGTNNRFEVDANLNVFTPKLQLSVVAAGNNANKSFNDIQTLVANSTFKGVGTRIDYQPDFKQSGLNRTNTAGASLTYDFIEKPDNYKKSSLNTSYYLQNKTRDYRSETQTISTLNSDNSISEKNSVVNLSNSTVQKANADYEWIKNQNSLKLSQSFNFSEGSNTETAFRSAENDQKVLLSTNNTIGTNNFKNSIFKLQAGYRKTESLAARNELLKSFRLNYQIGGYNNSTQQLNITDFRSFVDPLTNKKFNRKYDNDNKGINQQLDFELNDLNNLLFGESNISDIELSVTNKISLSNNNEHNNVLDFDTIRNNYRNNEYLSNQFETNRTEEMPGLTLAKTITKNLSNRFNKNITLSVSAKQTFISFDSKSQRSFQNLNRTYSTFLPEASFLYYNHQYGEFSKTYNLSFSTSVNIPTLGQLAPLTDSTNLYYLRRGNLALKESVTRTISFSYNYNSQTKNIFSYGLQITAGKIENNIVDSILIDDQNRRTIYPINANGSRFFNAGINLKKAFKFKLSELQFNIKSNGTNSRNPNYVNGLFTYSSNFNTDTHLNTDFTYKGFLAFAIDQFYSTYQSKQSAFNTDYRGKNIGTTLSTSYNITKKLTFNTNITFNSSSSSRTDDINYAIWNANAVYRFLKGNNAEFKLSALDLLRQNTSIINYGNLNSFTIGTQNVLRQYFIITFSYYPRQFGKKTKK